MAGEDWEEESAADDLVEQLALCVHEASTSQINRDGCAGRKGVRSTSSGVKLFSFAECGRPEFTAAAVLFRNRRQLVVAADAFKGRRGGHGFQAGWARARVLPDYNALEQAARCSVGERLDAIEAQLHTDVVVRETHKGTICPS